MKKNKAKQLYLHQFYYPYESLKTFLTNDNIEEYFRRNENHKIKKFLGSNWSIKDSGFIYYGSPNLSITFFLKNIINNDFILKKRYIMTYINNQKTKEEFEFVSSLIKNTYNNSCILEFKLEYDTDQELANLERIIKLSMIKKIVSYYYTRINPIINEISSKNTFNIVLNHSFLIKKNYKEAFNFFYNWNNLAKSIKTDKIWKICHDKKKSENESEDFYVIINDIKIHYHIICIDEIKNENIEISYNKTNNSVPALNNYIKFSFYNIANDLCFFLYETHLPINISSSIYQTVSKYLYYCNKKSKNYIENNYNILQLK